MSRVFDYNNKASKHEKDNHKRYNLFGKVCNSLKSADDDNAAENNQQNADYKVIQCYVSIEDMA